MAASRSRSNAAFADETAGLSPSDGMASSLPGTVLLAVACSCSRARMGDGTTRKSRTQLFTLVARYENLAASWPSALRQTSSSGRWAMISWLLSRECSLSASRFITLSAVDSSSAAQTSRSTHAAFASTVSRYLSTKKSRPIKRRISNATHQLTWKHSSECYNKASSIPLDDACTNRPACSGAQSGRRQTANARVLECLA